MDVLNRIFKCEHRFDEIEIILDAYKDGYKSILQTQNETPPHWDKVKDWRPKCKLCGRPLKEIEEQKKYRIYFGESNWPFHYRPCHIEDMIFRQPDGKTITLHLL